VYREQLLISQADLMPPAPQAYCMWSMPMLGSLEACPPEKLML